MKAVVFHGVGDIRLDEVDEPNIKDKHDAIVRLTASAICGTDLHMIRGTMPGMKSGTILGHEGVGVIEKLGKDVRNFHIGDRVVVSATIGCGYCSYCRAGYFGQCDNSRPGAKLMGPALFGGPIAAGAIDGMQAEKVRVPFANVGLVKIPDNVTDDQAVLLADIFPTGYYAADMADIKEGHIVVVLGCGPVGLFCIISAFLMGAGRVIAVDRLADRLAKAQELGAEVVNFEEEDPVEAIRHLTGNIGADSIIDAVGVDAEPSERELRQSKNEENEIRQSENKTGQSELEQHELGQSENKEEKHEEQVKKVAPKQNPQGDLWQPGKAPFQAIEWAIDAVAKAGIISIVGVYPHTADEFPIGKAMQKNLTLRMGHCNHRKYIPFLLELVASGRVEPRKIVTKHKALNSAIEAYEAFDRREAGWVKVELNPKE